MINFSDFITATMTHQEAKMNKAKIQDLFKIFDINDDNEIDKKDIKNAFNKLGRDITDDEVDLILDQHDMTNDHKINQREFKYMVKDIARSTQKRWGFFDKEDFDRRFKSFWEEVAQGEEEIGKEKMLDLATLFYSHIGRIHRFNKEAFNDAYNEF